MGTAKFTTIFGMLSALLLLSTAAVAAPITINDQMDSSATLRLGDYGGLTLGNFANRAAGGRHWGDELYDPGHRFDTTQMTVERTDTSTLTIKMHTSFNGDDEGAKYADLFLDNRTAGLDSFNYAIALGYQSMGVGLYSIGSAATANDIWGGRDGMIYGGYTQLKSGVPGYDPNMAVEATTRLTSGTVVAGSTVSVTRTDVGGGFFDIAVALQATSLSMFNNFDIFWGTGDCGNDSIWGSVALSTAAPVESPVDAPAAVALLITGLILLVIQHRMVRRWISAAASPPSGAC